MNKNDSSKELKDLKKKIKPSVLNDTSISNIKEIIIKEHAEDVQRKKTYSKIEEEQPVKVINY